MRSTLLAEDNEMVTTETVATLETVSRKLSLLGDALLGNATLAESSVTEPEVFLALHEHVVEIQRAVQALDIARATESGA